MEGVSHVTLRLTGARALTERHLFGNREEMRAHAAKSTRALTSDERAMINRVLDLQKFYRPPDCRPLARIAAVEKETSLGKALELARGKKFSRLPVWEMREGLARALPRMLLLEPLLFRDDLDLTRPVSRAHDARIICEWHVTPGNSAAPDATLRPSAGRRARAAALAKSA